MSALTAFRARTGRLAGRLLPGLEDRAFNRARNFTVPASQSPRGGHQPPAFRDRSPHIVVVPQEGPKFESWRSGTRNFYYEAHQTARELFGEKSVSVLDVAPGERSDSWQRRLRDHLHDTGATHVLTHIEHDPGSPDEWTWDIAWNELSPKWDGVLLGVMFDSAFSLVTMKSRRIARISPNFLAVDICTSMNSVLVPGRVEVGPVTMPVSRQSTAMVMDRIKGVVPSHDVSFIGVMYPYRVELVKRLRAAGVDVAVNPHRSDQAEDPSSSRRTQPSWLEYMAGLASSRMTINFSRFSSGDAEQLKTRVIEATLAGTFLLTDDRNSTQLYFNQDVEFGWFRGVDDLPQVIEAWRSKPIELDEGRRSAQAKAMEIGATDFWNRIQGGLATRRLAKLSK